MSYNRPSYAEVRLMNAEQKQIHAKQMQELRKEKDFEKYGCNYMHQRLYQKKQSVKDRLKLKYHNEKLDTHIEKVRVLINELFNVNAMNWKKQKIQNMNMDKTI